MSDRGSLLRAGLWLAAVGGAALLGLGVVVLLMGDGDGQEAPNLCDRPLPALSAAPVVKHDFDVADNGLQRVIGLAEQGNVGNAQTEFFLLAHDLTHNIDGPLRATNEDLAKKLCRAVVQIEAEFAGGGDGATIAEEAAGIRDLLRETAAELGFD